MAVSFGALVAGAGGPDDIGTLGIAFAVGTFGSRDHSLTAGFGLARELGDRFAGTEPILMVGGQARLSDSIAVVSENWLVLDGEVPLSEQPFGLALRFFNGRHSADVGVVLVGELLDEGLPAALGVVHVPLRAGKSLARRPSRAAAVWSRPEAVER